MRGGGSLGALGSYRGYGLALQQGSMVDGNGESVEDSWSHVQGGFRADWRGGGDTFTLQGDGYRGTGIGRPGFLPSGTISGNALSATWQRAMKGGAGLRVQTYVDTARRVLVSGIDARVDQYAIEAQYNVAPLAKHAVVIGGGYRMTDDDFTRGPGTAFLSPANRSLVFANAFVQDSITLTERLRLAIGTKLEHNTYTGVEAMPDARLAWTPSRTATFWTAVSRAVRTPSRFDTDLINPGILRGGPDFHSETLLAYEAGYRGLITPVFSLSVSAFYNSYDELRTVEGTGPAVFPLAVRNGMRGDTKGIEAWASYSVGDGWRLSAGLATLQKNLRLAAGSRDVFGVGFAGNDPRYQWSLRSESDLPGDLTANLSLRRVGRLEDPAVDGYLEADARISWKAGQRLTLSLDGQSLLHEHHLEFVNTAIGAREVPRSLTLAVRWTP